MSQGLNVAVKYIKTNLLHKIYNLRLLRRRTETNTEAFATGLVTGNQLLFLIVH